MHSSVSVLSAVYLALSTSTLATPLQNRPIELSVSDPFSEARVLRRGIAGAAIVEHLSVPEIEAQGYDAFREWPVAFAEQRSNKVSTDVVELTAMPGSAPSSRMINMLLGDAVPEFASSTDFAQVTKINGSAPMTNIRNEVFLTNITFGGEPFTAVLDTGSADTWLVGSDFQCMDAAKQPIENERCLFGATYVKTPTFQPLPDMHFNISYVDGEQLIGILGRERVSLGGVNVINQTVAVVDHANWHGDGISSGLIGLAFPSVTQAVSGSAGQVLALQQGPVTETNTTGNATAATRISYDPVFFEMSKQGLIDPTFSIAINRPEEAPGVLALGGVPPNDTIRYSADFARAPMEVLTFRSQRDPKALSLYMVKAGGITVKDQRYISRKGFNVVIDSGTTLAYLPSDVATAINQGFDPPALLEPRTRHFFVRCNATAPRVSISIGGKDVVMDGKDLVMAGSGLCMSGIQVATGLSLLGGPFMKGVLSVFDVGASEMRFANRIR